MTAAEIMWMRRKLNTDNMVTNRLLDGIMCENIRGKPIIHLTLTGLKCSPGVCEAYFMVRVYFIICVCDHSE
jgi:hypothetical protein